MSKANYNIKEETEMEELLKAFFKANKEPFNCEATFQFNLAMFIKENCKNVDKIVFEENIYGHNDKARCDLVVYLTDNHKVFIELKYVINGIYKTNGKEREIETTSGGARKSFVSDFRRLKAITEKNSTKYCIFISNKDAVLKTGRDSTYRCQKYFNEKFRFDYIENKQNEGYEHCHIIDKLWRFDNNRACEQTAKCLLVNVNKTPIEINDDYKCERCNHRLVPQKDGKEKICEYIIND